VISPAEEQRALADVEAGLFLSAAARQVKLETTLAYVLREAIDLVLNPAITGRYEISQLTPLEQTHIGTHVESGVKRELALKEGVTQDCLVAGHEVNIKWSKTCEWMIGPENVGHVCFGLGFTRKPGAFRAGVFCPYEDRLRRGKNRDTKLTLTAAAFRNCVRWIIPQAPFPGNFIAGLDPDLRTSILSAKSGTERIRRLVTSVTHIPIPRSAFFTIAPGKGDPLRRIRQDTYRTKPLGVRVLHTQAQREELLALGYLELPPGHWVSVPEEEYHRAFPVDRPVTDI
jgi:hypothetical protein